MGAAAADPSVLEETAGQVISQTAFGLGPDSYKGLLNLMAGFPHQLLLSGNTTESITLGDSKTCQNETDFHGMIKKKTFVITLSMPHAFRNCKFNRIS